MNTRLGCETLCTTNKIVIAGEGRGQAPLFSKYDSHAVVNREMISQIARNVVRDIGYDQDGFSYHGADIEVLLHGQSPDIAMGVDAKKKKGEEQEGAGDQGMMFGFACTESEVYEKGSFMPAPIYFAHKILKVLAEKRRSKQLFDLQPDAKSQVTVQYVAGKPIGCTKVVVSTQHNAETRNGKKYSPAMVKDLIGDAVASALPEGWMPKRPSDFLVNPTGNFVVGGPDGDCGLTGRKIIVDTYGGYAPHGGGAFSGKDPTKVDCSAAYAARYLAKNVVAAGIAERCTIQIAYAIGVADPMYRASSTTHGTGKVDEKKLEKALPRNLPAPLPTNIRPHAQAEPADRTGARLPTAISAAPRTRTAASPGNAPIWSTSLHAAPPRKAAPPGIAPAMVAKLDLDEQRDRQCRRTTSAPSPATAHFSAAARAGRCGRARPALMERLLPRLALALDRPAPDDLRQNIVLAPGRCGPA